MFRQFSRLQSHQSRTSTINSFLSTSKTCDYLVMGGGPVGLSTALHLAMNGAKNIIVVEKDSSYRNCSAMLSAGGIRQQFSVPENIKMSLYGIDFIKNIDRLKVNEETPDVQFHEIGYLFLANEKNRSTLEKNHQTQLDNGVTWMKLLEECSLQSQFPWLNTVEIVLGSTSTKNEGYFDPWLLIQVLKNKILSMGVEIIEGTVVNGKLSPKSSSVSNHKIAHIDVLSSNKTHTVISSGNYINCAGAWGGRIIEKLKDSVSNPKVIRSLPVNPRKRNVFVIHCPGLVPCYKPVPPKMTPLVVDITGVFFRPEGDNPGRFITGVSPPEEEDYDVLEGNEKEELSSVNYSEFEDIIWPALYERVPAFQELKVISSWAGFYDYNSFDQNAIIGYHSEIENLMLCNGFSGHGLQQSPAAGRASAELLLNENKYLDKENFNLERFSFERVINNTPIFETGIV